MGRATASAGAAAEDATSLPAPSLAPERLAALRDATAESVQLFVRDGDERVCIVALQSPHGLRTIVPLGARLPLGVGSAGRVLLGEGGSGNWIESVEEREAGVASVSAAVRDPRGVVIAAVSVSGPIERTSRAPGDRYGAAVMAAARRIELAAGHA